MSEEVELEIIDDKNGIIRHEVTDVSNKTCYALPLSPQDLVAIYKDKGEDSDNKFVLWVNYGESRLKLSPAHILIYLANTNFYATFSGVDEELLVEYIKTDFLVDAPILARIITNIIKTKYGHELSELEMKLYNLFDQEQIAEFIENQGELLDDLIENVKGLIPFVLHHSYNNLSDEDKKTHTDLKETLKELTPVDKPTKCGPNVAMLVQCVWDMFLVITTYEGISQEFNTNMYNDKPKYNGSDLFVMLNATNVISNVIEFLPPGLLLPNIGAE
jgi:hypothetical protein